MKKWKELLEKRWFSNSFAICSGVLLYMILSHMDSITGFFHTVSRLLSPIVIGIILAYLIDPIALFFEKRIFRKLKKDSIRRTLSVSLAIIVILMLIVLFFAAVIPSLVGSITGIFESAGDYSETIASIMDRVNSWNMGFNLDFSSFTENLENILTKGIGLVRDNLENIVDVSKNIGSSLFNLVIGFILCIYFLTGKNSLVSGIDELRQAVFSDRTLKTHNSFWARCHQILIQYIGYNFLDGVIVGFTNAIVMMILRIPYVALVSVIVGVTNLLPTFGPVIGLTVGCLILLLVKPVYVVWFAISVCVIQTLDGYVLKPRLFGGALGIPPVWTLISIILGGKLFGVAGILLAIPFAAVLTFLYKESFLPWLKNRNKK